MKVGLYSISLFFPLFFFLIDTTEGFIQHEKYKNDYDANNIHGRYIVELNEIENNQASFASQLKTNYEKEVTMGETFNHRYFKGMTFDFNDPNPDHYKRTFMELLDHHQVKKIYPVKQVSRPEFKPIIMSEVKPNDVPALSPHSLTQVDRVQKELKNTGEGITVCILDTGVDYNHPALGGGFGPGYKVILGEDLVGDDYDGNNTPKVKPGAPPLDNCGKEKSGSGGHGTHVSGIIAGKLGNYVGVAPDAKLGMYRVFGCEGSSSTDVILSALLKAADASCDIINLSLGSTNSWSTGIQAEVINNIVNSGKSVVAAAGNDGNTGAFTISNPSSVKGAMSIASFNNENQIVSTANVTGASFTILYYGSTSKGNMTDGEVAIGSNTLESNQQACEASDVPIDVKGKYALVKRGACEYATKANNVQKAGAIGLIVYNNPEDDPFVTSAESETVPTIGISKTQGLELIKAIQKGKVSITFSKGTEVPIKLSGAKTVSSFSGVGATYDLELHPHLGGIGGNVYSTLPTYIGSWGTLSGTSMATPYISGCIALFMKALGKNTMKPEFILQQLQHYSYKAPKKNGEYNLDSPLRQGAGLIQLFDSIQQKVHVNPAQLSFNDTSSDQYKTQIISITNYGNQMVTYQLQNNASLSVKPYDLQKTGYAFTQPIGYSNDVATFTFSMNTILLKPKQTINITVTVKPPNTDPKEHIMYGGYIQFSSTDRSSSLDLTLPYFGIVGKQKELPIFDTEKGYPYLSLQPIGPDKEKSSHYLLHRNNTVIETVYINYRLLTGSANIDFNLLHAFNKTLVGSALPSLNNTRRHELEGNPLRVFTSTEWDGTYYPINTKMDWNLDPVPVPTGVYVIQIKALRQFGDLNLDNDYETWISPEIEIVG